MNNNAETERITIAAVAIAKDNAATLTAVLVLFESGMAVEYRSIRKGTVSITLDVNTEK